MPTRSLVLAAHRSAGPENAYLVTCPAATTLLLKSAYCHNWNAASASLTLYVIRPSGPASALIFNVQLATQAHAEWQGWVALEPGDLVQLAVDVATVDVWLSGTALPGTMTLPPAVGTLPAPTTPGG